LAGSRRGIQVAERICHWIYSEETANTRIFLWLDRFVSWNLPSRMVFPILLLALVLGSAGSAWAAKTVYKCTKDGQASTIGLPGQGARLYDIKGTLRR
jgi:hypothetical protein